MQSAVNIKTYVFLLLQLLLFTPQNTYSDNTWISQNSNTTKTINRICFTDSLTGWAAGDSGLIIHTTSGGALWFLQNSNTLFDIKDLIFLNSSTGWALASFRYGWPNTTLLRTTNGGSSWQSYPLQDTSVLINSITFGNAQTGWAGGFLGTILKTTNSGVNWIAMPHDSSPFTYTTIYKIRTFTPDISFACGGLIDRAGVCWKLNPEQSIWNSRPLAAEPLYDVVLLDSSNALCVGGDPEYGIIVLKSSDAGENWIYNSPELFGIARTIAKRTPAEIWLGLFFSNEFCLTTDGGNFWYKVPTPENLELGEVFFLDSTHGWAGGEAGRIFKYNREVIGIEPVTGNAPARYSLSDFYPNPFNPLSSLTLQLFENAFVKIELFDVLGRNIMNIQNGMLRQGSYVFHVDGKSLSSGTYFCRILVDDELIFKKLVLLK